MRMTLICLTLTVLLAACGSTRKQSKSDIPVNLLTELAYRDGEKPKVATKKFQNFYLQFEIIENNPVKFRRAFVKKLNSLEKNLNIKQASIGPQGGLSIRMKKEFPYFNEQASLYESKREFARLNQEGDGSLEIRLAEIDAYRIVSRGWGVRHPVYKGAVLIYAPQTEDELKVFWKIFSVAYHHARNE